MVGPDRPPANNTLRVSVYKRELVLHYITHFLLFILLLKVCCNNWGCGPTDRWNSSLIFILYVYIFSHIIISFPYRQIPSLEIYLSILCYFLKNNSCQLHIRFLEGWYGTKISHTNHLSQSSKVTRVDFLTYEKYIFFLIVYASYIFFNSINKKTCTFQFLNSLETYVTLLDWFIANCYKPVFVE